MNNVDSNFQKQLITMLSKNYFSLFELPLFFKIDHEILKQKRWDLQKQYHPDNHQHQNLVNEIVTLSSYINQAYQVLICPYSRAQYLLNLLNTDSYNKSNDIISQDQDLLIQQMKIREDIETAINNDNQCQLTELEKDVSNTINQLEKQIGTLFELKHYQHIQKQIDRLLFYQKTIDIIIEAKML